MIYKIQRVLILLIFLSVSAFSFAEDPPPPPPCPGPYDPPVGPPPAPIENGVSVVVGLALFYGALKLYQTRKKLKEKEE